MTALRLAFGLSFDALYRRDGLARIDDAFCATLRDRDAGLAQRFVDTRALLARGEPLAAKEEAGLLLSVAPWLEGFLGELFDFD